MRENFILSLKGLETFVNKNGKLDVKVANELIRIKMDDPGSFECTNVFLTQNQAELLARTLIDAVEKIRENHLTKLKEIHK